MGRMTNEQVDDLIQHNYEEALAEEEPWALDAYEHRIATPNPTG